MLAKWWRKIGLFILIVACLFNITSKLVKRVSFSDNVKGTVSNKVENVVTQVKGDDTNNQKDIKDIVKKSKEEVNYMREGIHPNYEATTITCACGNVMETNSTKKDMKVDICSKCHPYWTGNLKRETTGGRADRFKKKYGLQ